MFCQAYVSCNICGLSGALTYTHLNTLLTLKFAAWVVIIEIAFTDDYNKKENKRRCCWQL